MNCTETHRYDQIFLELPEDQGGDGRHKCCGCAYDAGFSAGRLREEHTHVNLEELPRSQAGAVRHKSPHAAWALGYLNGVRSACA